jgi:hypothetical protein
MKTKRKRQAGKKVPKTKQTAAVIRSAAAADYADRLLEIRGEQPLNSFERGVLAALGHRRAVEVIADLALLVPRDEIFPGDPDLTNAMCGLSDDTPEVEEVVDESAVRSWIPNARTQAAMKEARTITLYNSARRHRLEAGC